MTAFKFEKGRIKVGKYSLTNLAMGEVIATAVIFILTIVFAWNAYKDARTYYAWRSALVHYSSRNPGQASEQVSNALSFRPEFAYPRELRAKMLLDSEDIDGARREYEDLLSRVPDSETARIGLGQCALREYDIKKDEKILKVAQQYFSEVAGNPDALIGLGSVYLRRGDLGNADKQFAETEKAEQPPSVDALFDMYMGQAWISYKRKEYDKARDNFERARFINPVFEENLANIAYMQARRMSVLQLTRDKFDTESPRILEFSDYLFARLSADTDGSKSYFKQALVSYFDALVCLAIRSGRLPNAANYMNALRAIDRNIKRPSLNYIQTVVEAVNSQNLTEDERRGYYADLDQRIEETFLLHKDMTPLEQATILQIRATKNIVENSAMQVAIDYIDRALEIATRGNLQDNVLLMSNLYRSKAIAQYKLAASEGALERAATIEKARKNVELSLSLDRTEDLESFNNKLKAAGNDDPNDNSEGPK